MQLDELRIENKTKKEEEKCLNAFEEERVTRKKVGLTNERKKFDKKRLLVWEFRMRYQLKTDWQKSIKKEKKRKEIERQELTQSLTIHFAIGIFQVSKFFIINAWRRVCHFAWTQKSTQNLEKGGFTEFDPL